VEIKVKEKAFLSLCNNRTRVNTVYDFSPKKEGEKKKRESSISTDQLKHSKCFMLF